MMSIQTFTLTHHMLAYDDDDDDDDALSKNYHL